MVSFQFLADWLIKLSDASRTNQTRKTKNPAERRIFFISEVQNRFGTFLSRILRVRIKIQLPKSEDLKLNVNILFSFWNFEQCANTHAPAA